MFVLTSVKANGEWRNFSKLFTKLLHKLTKISARKATASTTTVQAEYHLNFEKIHDRCKRFCVNNLSIMWKIGYNCWLHKVSRSIHNLFVTIQHIDISVI